MATRPFNTTAGKGSTTKFGGVKDFTRPTFGDGRCSALGSEKAFSTVCLVFTLKTVGWLAGTIVNKGNIYVYSQILLHKI